LHITEFAIVDIPLQHAKHFRLNVFSDDLARWSDYLGEAPYVITDTGSDIGNNRALLDIERGQHALGIFLPNSFRTNEPIGALSGHDGRRLALDLRLLSRSNQHQGQQKRGEK